MKKKKTQKNEQLTEKICTQSAKCKQNKERKQRGENRKEIWSER